MIDQVERVRVIPFRRSAFQVALLMFVTLGLYFFVWAYFMRRACASLLEQEDQPLWKSVALIVPILNFFLMFELGKKIEGVQWRADPARVDGSLPWIGLSMFAFTVFGRVNTPASSLGVLNLVPIAVMQQKFARAQIALLGDAGVPTGFHWLEWIAIVLGGAFWGLAVLGMVAPAHPDAFEPAERGWFLASIALVLGVLVLFGATSRRTTAQGLAMHADPSPDRIAPYA